MFFSHNKELVMKTLVAAVVLVATLGIAQSAAFAQSPDPQVAQSASVDTTKEVLSRADFLGTWSGKWCEGRTATLVVKRVDGDTAETTYSWGWFRGNREGSVDRTGEFVAEGTLQIMGSAKIRFRLIDKETISGNFSEPRRRPCDGIFARE